MPLYTITTSNKPKRKLNHYDDDTIVTIVKMVKRGDSPYDLGNKFGISFMTIMGWCKRLGVPYKKGPSKKRDWEKLKAML